MTRLQTIRYSVWGAAAFVLLGLAAFYWTSARVAEPETSAVVTIGGPFALVADTGEAITEADLVGHISLLFFGFTHCPDVCPTAMAEATAWLDELGTDSDGLVIYFVTVDPTRDTPAAMNAYLSAFHPDIVGLSGSAEAVDQMLDAFHVFREQISLADGGYTMNHSAGFYVLDDKGRFIDVIDPNDGHDAAISEIRSAIAGGV